MHEIKAQFVGERGPVRSRLAMRRFHADENLAVLERDHVGRAGDSHEATVEFAHPAIGNEKDLNFLQTRQAWTATPLAQAEGERPFRKSSERGPIERDLSLPIVHRNSLVEPMLSCPRARSSETSSR